MAGAPRATRQIGFRIFRSKEHERARGVPAMLVGSGALLGDRANPIERSPETARWSPDTHAKTSLPLRVFELPTTVAGDEPFDAEASHASCLELTSVKHGCELRMRSGST